MNTLVRIRREQLRLYLVTDSTLCKGRSLYDVVAAAVRGGVTCVQLREKELGTREFVARALALKSLLSPLHIPLVINDRIDVALACQADGVHLGQSDMPVDLVRKILPPEVFIGLSVENDQDIVQALCMPMDYLGISPVFATPTKTDTPTPWGLAGLERARAMTDLPLVAIGGINAGNAAQVSHCGADGLAVVSAICAADDPASAARELFLLATTPNPNQPLP
ncbi:thiamine phosphate synthase [Limnohabitans sp. Rim8]|uniref:thiamine phosphate synthase n=1 Tax=Limnohabitans sp. Rim8 TaxID=1100718 RepID=UPI0025F9EFD8|nr:thiamine phosphate synthase [Limnohabitans sp. Rim8]